jgi:hypothetical protein
MCVKNGMMAKNIKMEQVTLAATGLEEQSRIL